MLPLIHLGLLHIAIRANLVIKPVLGPLRPLVLTCWHNSNTAVGLLRDEIEGLKLKRQFLLNSRVPDLTPLMLCFIKPYKCISIRHMAHHLHRHSENAQAGKGIGGVGAS